MKYRVVIKVGYREAIFEFDDITKAGEFASAALTNSIPSDDADKATYVTILVAENFNSDVD